MIEALESDYVRAARSLGLLGAAVVFRHAFRNALLPLMTMVAIVYGYLLGGVVLVEKIFAWPGLGRYVFNAITSSDYPAVQGFILYATTIYVLLFLIVDLLYRVVDPRIRRARAARGDARSTRPVRAPGALRPRVTRSAGGRREPGHRARVRDRPRARLLAVLAPLIAPYDPNAFDPTAVLQGPVARHFFGTGNVRRGHLLPRAVRRPQRPRDRLRRGRDRPRDRLSRRRLGRVPRRHARRDRACGSWTWWRRSRASSWRWGSPPRSARACRT